MKIAVINTITTFTHNTIWRNNIYDFIIYTHAYKQTHITTVINRRVRVIEEYENT